MPKMSQLRLHLLRTLIGHENQVAVGDAATNEAIANARLKIDLSAVKGVLYIARWTDVRPVLVATRVPYTAILEANLVGAEERTKDEEVVHTVTVDEEGDFMKEEEIAEGTGVDDTTTEVEIPPETEAVDTKMDTKVVEEIEEDVITKEEDTVDEKSEETATMGSEIVDETVGATTEAAMRVANIRMLTDKAEEVAGGATKTEEEIVEQMVVDRTTMAVDLVNEVSEGVAEVLPILAKVEEGITRERSSQENHRW